MHYQVKWQLNKKRAEFSLIYSSSDSSVEEKSFKLPLICLINFSQCIYTLLKTLADNNSHQNSSKLLLNKYD